LVEKVQIHRREFDRFLVFSPKQFNCSILRHFSALTNVQELGIDYLDIPRFMPRIRRYFGHFSPTLRSLALREPEGSRRQIIYFIGLFKHLEDLKLLYDPRRIQGEPANHLTLVPLFTPPLRGRLTITSFTRVGILKDMIDLFGGIRFRYMDLCGVDGMRLLLDACAETLETLRLYPTELRGKGLSSNSVPVLTDNFTAVSSPQDFDLSQNKSLQTLEVPAEFVDRAMKVRSQAKTIGILSYALSTITSPAFSEVAAFYRDYDFAGVDTWWSDPPFISWLSSAQWAEETSRHLRLLRAFQRVQKVRGFQLVLCVDVWDGVGKHCMQMMNRVVAAEKGRWWFGKISPEPLVVYSPRGSRPLSGQRDPWASL
jgi:hypothetical protein